MINLLIIVNKSMGNNTLLYIIGFLAIVYYMKTQEGFKPVASKSKAKITVIKPYKFDKNDTTYADFVARYKSDIDEINTEIDRMFYDSSKSEREQYKFELGGTGNFEREDFVKLSSAMYRLSPHQKYVAAYIFLHYISVYNEHDKTFYIFYDFILPLLIALLQLKDNRSKSGYTIDVGTEVSKIAKLWWS